MEPLLTRTPREKLLPCRHLPLSRALRSRRSRILIHHPSPPPTTHLSGLFPFDPDSGQITPPNQGGAIPRAPGADENAPNQLPHNYNTSLFHPEISTPFGMDLPSFTYPEPPASPSPAARTGI